MTDTEAIVAAITHEAFFQLSSPWTERGDWRCSFNRVRVGNVEVSVSGCGKTAGDACRSAVDAWERAKGSEHAHAKALPA